MTTNQEVRKLITDHKSTQKARGITVLNNDTNYFHKLLKKSGKVLEIPNYQRILTANKDQKTILVSQDFVMEDIPEQNRGKSKLVEVEIQLNYKNYENQQIFEWFTKQAFDDGKNEAYIPFPNSFETVGHMAHYNLTPEQEKFKTVIGEITILKCPNIQTVVNKTEKLHNVYRTPTLQHMAGERNYTVKLKEQGVNFELDFEKVYWCSRLQQQRDRLLKLMNSKQLLADIFCGVGPLAVRAAKKGLYVIANDLNPSCHEYLTLNCKINKIEDKVKCWCMCAREAMRRIYKEKDSYSPEFQYPDHIYMNLPVDAIEFLDVLSNYAQQMNTNKMPLVHVNCFVVADSDQKSKQLLSIRIKKVLPSFQPEDIIHMHHIKNVTVIMRMYCISIRLRAPDVEMGDVEAEQNYEKMEKKVKLN